MVGRRTNEIGIRMALGAARSSVRWLVMREILLLVVLGIGIGVPVALAGNRLIADRLFGVKSANPLGLAGAALVVLLVGLAASYFPARRAAKVDPMVALRYE